MSFRSSSCDWRRFSVTFKPRTAASDALTGAPDHLKARKSLRAVYTFQTRFLAPVRTFNTSHGPSDSRHCLGQNLTTQHETKKGFSHLDSSPNRDIVKALDHSAKELLSRRDVVQQYGYPRITNEGNHYTCRHFCSQFSHLKNKETLANAIIEVRGRVTSIRVLGRNLHFIDVSQDGHKLQVVCSWHNIPHVADEEKDRRLNSLRRGDIISISGNPYRTARGELSIKATVLPVILVPCLQSFPEHTNAQTGGERPADNKALNSNVEIFALPGHADDLRRRSAIIQGIRDFFRNRAFLEVDTPILAGSAGGALARAFETSAVEFPDRNVSLRIAPELWLKRLIVGGLERVFEIGPAFRNEGLDKTHNPEFHTCEFYSTYTTLDELISTTQELMKAVLQFSKNQEIAKAQPTFCVTPFIPTLETAINTKLPPLHLPNASSSLLEVFDKHSVPKPNLPTLPRLLDKLATHFLEPSFKGPSQSFVFLSQHPAALSPLSKSYFDSESGQYVAARAELYINGLEIANMYEEENDPCEQREKFLQQARWAAEGVAPAPASVDTEDRSLAQNDVDKDLKIDEDYIRALEWGLPPTGGWGCGIDRLVMVLLEKERITDVLPFGGLRGLTRNAGRRKAEGKKVA